jgi:uroporphyrin-III C-methyltransferase/precorrin-2 dehydrogenase/sirohydrochlorin ferrochelatase
MGQRLFPVFLDLERRRCLVVGGGDEAARKAMILCRAGARVAVVAETLAMPLVRALQRGDIEWLDSLFAPALLDGVALVIVADVAHAVADVVSVAARARGIPVNVVDEPRRSSFIMPAIIDRAPVMVAISTGGTAPALAARLRVILDRLLPERLGDLAALAGRFRPLARQRLAADARRRFWKEVFGGPVADLALAGREAEAGAALAAALDEAAAARRGAALKRRSG